MSAFQSQTGINFGPSHCELAYNTNFVTKIKYTLYKKLFQRLPLTVPPCFLYQEIVKQERRHNLTVVGGEGEKLRGNNLMHSSEFSKAPQ